jgi:hypothetical protein
VRLASGRLATLFNKLLESGMTGQKIGASGPNLNATVLR